MVKASKKVSQKVTRIEHDSRNGNVYVLNVARSNLSTGEVFLTYAVDGKQFVVNMGYFPMYKYRMLRRSIRYKEIKLTIDIEK